jgi:hypothetical protein
MPILSRVNVDAFVTFSHQDDIKPGMIVREKAGCSLPRKDRQRGFFVILELRDDEPLFDGDARNGSAGFGMPLDIVIGKVNEHGDRISVWVDRWRF